MEFKNTEVYGFEHALRGMRNPLESWAKSDSKFHRAVSCEECIYSDEDCHIAEHCISLGENDLGLATKLIKGGSEHRKFLRQIQVWVDITAPLYWWKEFDTYKVGTVANSTSTMHKLMSKPITAECFELDDIFPDIEKIIDICEMYRKQYVETKDKEVWRRLVQMLPESWLQTRTVSLNYENLRTMVHQRKGHKLKEWSEDFMSWVNQLPYAKELILEE